jgi:hypothetical protein
MGNGKGKGAGSSSVELTIVLQAGPSAYRERWGQATKGAGGERGRRSFIRVRIARDRQEEAGGRAQGQVQAQAQVQAYDGGLGGR